MNIRRASDSPPRKVLIGTVMHWFRGSCAERLETACRLIDAVAHEAARKYPGKGLDLIVLPEHAIQEGQNPSAESRAVPIEGDVLENMGQKARQYRTYLILPMTLRETKMRDGKETLIFSNVAVVLDRDGKPVGTYRKVHPVSMPPGMALEYGIMPGDNFLVFECDFGKLGILICWDQCYEDGWLELGRKGAEIVAITTASPQTIRPAFYAECCNYYVVTSSPRNNISIFNPAGLVAAQSTSENVLVHEVDLAYARLEWLPNLDNGEAFTRAYGDKAGYLYSEREDRGVFWSNDPETSIGCMVSKLGLIERDLQVAQDLRLQDAARGYPAKTGE